MKKASVSILNIKSSFKLMYVFLLFALLVCVFLHHAYIKLCHVIKILNRDPDPINESGLGHS